MRFLQRVVGCILFLVVIQLYAQQEVKFGKVSKEALLKNGYEIDTSAAAIMLFKSRESFFEYDHVNGFVQVTEVHQRIKILKKSGLDFATHSVRLYRDDEEKEVISKIKGYTHNLENGKVKKDKLSKSGIFANELNERASETSITLPNAKVGSVVEWTYTITSPFWDIDDLNIQEDIPVLHDFAKIRTLEFFNFKRIVKGPYQINSEEYVKERNMNVSFNELSKRIGAFGSMTVNENIVEYEHFNIPALKEERYVDNIDNYRFSVSYELQAVQFPEKPVKQYSTSWEEVVKIISEKEGFGGQLKNTLFLKNKAIEIYEASANEMELMHNVYDYVKNYMTWNKKLGKYAREGIEMAHRSKTGDVAEINLMLTALLRECGLNAAPVLVSTRSHGIPAFPTLAGFNYVVAQANVGDQSFLLDATDKFCVPNILPQRVLNWDGTLVLPDGNFKKIDLYPKAMSQRSSMLNINLDSDGFIAGNYSCNYTNLYALNFRKALHSLTDDEYTEDLLEEWQLDEISALDVKNKEALSKSITIKCDFQKEEGVSFAGNDMYFSPLLFLAIDENPFKSEDRAFPINYSFPLTLKRIVNIKLPEGYQVSEIPKPMRLALPEGLGSYMYNISKVPGGLSLVSVFKINEAVIPTAKYQELKEFYNQRLQKETENVVLTKL